MKKLLLSSLFFLGGIGLTFSQCSLGSSYQGDAAPTPGNSVTMTTCAFAGEYQTITAVTSGNDYTITYTGGASNYVTIYDAAFTAIAWGASPLIWTAPSSGTFYSQPNLDDGLCGTDGSCHTGIWMNTSPPPPCPAEIAPWIENFTTTVDPTCWSQSTTSGGPWIYTGSPDFGTNPGNIMDHTSGVLNNYAWMDHSSTDVGVILQTPEIDVTALATPELRFWIMSHNNTTSVTVFNDIFVEASDGAGGWSSVATINGDFGFQWEEFTFIASSYIYGVNLVQFRFRAESGGDINDYDNDMLLDDVEVREAPTCPQPINLTLNSIGFDTLNVTWTSQGTETEWVLEYGAPGFTPGTGTYVTTTNNPETIYGLTAETSYDVYVRATCTPGDTSFYTGALNVLTTPTCPAPSSFNVVSSDLTSADFDWFEEGTATEWQLEYGTTGFTPETGFGTEILTLNNPESITALASNSFFEVYLQAVCSPGDTSTLVGPLEFNTYNQGLYMDNDNACPAAGFVDISGTGTNVNLTDDGEIGVTMPFSVLYQGTIVLTDLSIGNNGDIKLNTLTGTTSFSGNMSTLADGLYPWLDDLDSETGGVYYETVGTSPNQVFIVQWDQRCNFSGSIGAPNVTFQVQIEEATGEIYYVYDDVFFGGSNVNDDLGANADIGISGPNQDINVSNNDPQYLTDNSCAHFFYTDCPNPVNYTVTYTTNDEAGLSWNAGIASETDWTVIYGPQGFDPLTSGTPINTTSPAVIIPGLDDITTYDVYIYADCNPGVTQSTGVFGQFVTLPNCSDPTTLATTTAVDSLMTTWMWVESAPAYPSTGFNVQYGMNGFGLYDGSETIVNADNNFSDTTEDVTLLGGGVYEVYIQGVCGVDTSNWVGPVTFTMPLSNDSTCNAIDLAVDGTVYTFDNSGATTQVNEATIAPPATGFQTSDGWGDSNIDFTTWFTFTAPASGNLNLSGLTQGFDGQFAVYEATDCSDVNTFTLVGANDDALDGSSAAPDFSICGLTPGNTYYLMHDSWSTVATGIYSIQLDEIAITAGLTNGIIDICTGDTANLFTGISGYDMGGIWTEEITTANFVDSIFPSAGLAYQVFNFEYTVVKGCAMDSVIQQVQIYGPSSAGIDGTINVCQNEPVDLLSGLSGNVDLGGQWYDPSNSPIPSAITASFIPGLFNYDYITSNGVCPNDTANVVVDVDATCDYLDIQEIVFGDMEVYPNPTTGVVYISNGNTEVFSFEVTDVKGRVVAAKSSAINGTETTEINLGNLEVGIYMIKVYNENAEKTFRVVKQ